MPARLVTGLAVLAILAPANTPDAAQLSEVDLRVADTTLALDATTSLRLKARMSDGRPADLDPTGEIVAYSKTGYESRTWTLPADWRHVRNVDIHQIGQDGTTFLAQAPVDGHLTLSVPAGTAVSITPSR